jgi:hypothetical protein
LTYPTDKSILLIPVNPAGLKNSASELSAIEQKAFPRAEPRALVNTSRNWKEVVPTLGNENKESVNISRKIITIKEDVEYFFILKPQSAIIL